MTGRLILNLFLLNTLLQLLQSLFNPTKEFENRQERFALYRAMQQLDAETREVIHLRLAGDFSFRDIGDILGHSEVWARVRFYRGKEKLVKIIGGDNNA